MKLNYQDATLLIFYTVLGIFAFYKLSTGDLALQSSFDEIAKVGTILGSSKTMGPTNLSWYQLKSGASLGDGNKVYTNQESKTRIDFKDGTSIELGEETLITLTRESIRLDGGKVKILKIGKNKDRKFNNKKISQIPKEIKKVNNRNLNKLGSAIKIRTVNDKRIEQFSDKINGSKQGPLINPIGQKSTAKLESIKSKTNEEHLMTWTPERIIREGVVSSSLLGDTARQFVENQENSSFQFREPASLIKLQLEMGELKENGNKNKKENKKGNKKGNKKKNVKKAPATFADISLKDQKICDSIRGEVKVSPEQKGYVLSVNLKNMVKKMNYKISLVDERKKEFWKEKIADGNTEYFVRSKIKPKYLKLYCNEKYKMKKVEVIKPNRVRLLDRVIYETTKDSYVKDMLLKWEPSLSAKKYEVKLYTIAPDKSFKIKHLFKTKKNELKLLKVKKGEYYFSVSVIDIFGQKGSDSGLGFIKVED